MFFLREKLNEIIKACGDFNKKAFKTAFDDIRQKTWTLEINNILNEISVNSLRGELTEVIAAAQKIKELCNITEE